MPRRSPTVQGSQMVGGNGMVAPPLELLSKDVVLHVLTVSESAAEFRQYSEVLVYLEEKKQTLRVSALMSAMSAGNINAKVNTKTDKPFLADVFDFGSALLTGNAAGALTSGLEIIREVAE